MKLSKQPKRRRCVICRLWYRPHRAAVRVQKTCSAICRRERRKRIAKRRRARALEKHREAERTRQAALRLRRAAGGIEQKPAVMSRADLVAEVAAVLDAALEKLDEPVAMSRADLRRQVLDVAREGARMAGQDWTGKRDCHAPA